MFNNKVIQSNLKYLLFATILAGTLLPATSFAASNKLPKDIDKLPKESREVIQDMYNKGLLSGYSDNTFRPTDKITRGEFAAMLVNSLGLTHVNSGQKFSDSTQGKDWNYTALNIASSNGLMSGEGTDSQGRPIMKPNDQISRLEMMIILVRANALNGQNVSLSNSQINQTLSQYKDQSQVPSWAKEDVAKAIKENITSGVGDNTLGVNQKGDRTQSALFSYRALNKRDENKQQILAQLQSIVTKYFSDVFTFNSVNNKYVTLMANDLVANKVNINSVSEQVAKSYVQVNPTIYTNMQTDVNTVLQDIKPKYDADLASYTNAVGEQQAHFFTANAAPLVTVEFYYRLTQMDSSSDILNQTQQALMQNSTYSDLYNKYKNQALQESNDAATQFDVELARYVGINTLQNIDKLASKNQQSEIPQKSDISDDNQD